MEIDLKINSYLTLKVFGEYKRGEPEIGLSSDFIIEDVNIEYGSVNELLEWIESIRVADVNYAAKECFTGFPSIWDIIADKCLEIIENE